MLRARAMRRPLGNEYSARIDARQHPCSLSSGVRRLDVEDLRLATAWLEDKQAALEPLANYLTLATIYRQRRQIELFFKLLKQQLKIKTLVGNAANAVRIQIWTAAPFPFLSF